MRRLRGFTLWSAFLLVHGLLAAVNLSNPGLSLPDVIVVYRNWVESGTVHGEWLALDAPWVYPVLALIPMLASLALGPGLQAVVWLAIVTVLDAVALWLLLREPDQGRAHRAAWWWVAFLLLLGPIAVTRIDAITVPIALAAVLLLHRRPAIAGLLLAAGAWMKIWPAALFLAALVAMRTRWRVLAGGAVISAVVIATGLLLGSGWNVLSFLTMQGSRGLQIESVAAVPFLWDAMLTGKPALYYDREMLTFQLLAPESEFAGAFLNPLLAVAVLGLLALGAAGLRRQADQTELLAVLSLGLVLGMLVFNKVGSPQLVTWLAVPIVFGMARLPLRTVALPVMLGLPVAALTQLVYPYLYDRLLALDPAVLVLLTLRNALYLVLLAWAVLALVRLARRDSQSFEPLVVDGVTDSVVRNQPRP
ncbi:MAG: DUF2029 domain-containing protein [Actinomycetota bacterium]|nr:DUF2029 domain-containing protein [Actinomycetota bacterium]